MNHFFVRNIQNKLLKKHIKKALGFNRGQNSLDPSTPPYGFAQDDVMRGAFTPLHFTP
jgi:hypothetical protein